MAEASRTISSLLGVKVCLTSSFFLLVFTQDLEVCLGFGYFDVPDAIDVVILRRVSLGHLTNFTPGQSRFFIFAFRSRVLQHGQRFWFGRSFVRHSHRFKFLRSFVFLRQSVYFRSFGDDDLRLLTGLGEDGELRGSSLFATTGLIPFGVDVGL